MQGETDEQRDPAVQNVVRRIKPQHRLKAVWAIARPKMVCEADSLEEENGDNTNEDMYNDENKPGMPKGHGGCGAEQPQYRKEALKLIGVFKPSKDKGEEGAEPERRNMPAAECYNILKKIPDEDLLIMGLNAEFARPDWMILTVLPVPPAAVRPSISVDGGSMRSEDDLTYKLGEILKASVCRQVSSTSTTISSSSTSRLTWTMTLPVSRRLCKSLAVPSRLSVLV
jgi:DNA-directed RNA polymerase II subunit RPB1